MSLGLVGRKVGMTRIFTDDGDSIRLHVDPRQRSRLSRADCGGGAKLNFNGDFADNFPGIEVDRPAFRDDSPDNSRRTSRRPHLRARKRTRL